MSKDFRDFSPETKSAAKLNKVTEVLTSARKMSRGQALGDFSGFTLVEAILTVTLISIIFALASQIFIQINRFVILNKARIELQREARAILPIINSNLRQASVNSITIDSVSGQPYYSRISFTKIDGTSYKFYQQNKQLIMETSQTRQVLSENLRYLSFVVPRSDDLTIVSVSLTLEKQITELRTKALHMASEKVMIMND